MWERVVARGHEERTQSHPFRLVGETDRPHLVCRAVRALPFPTVHTSTGRAPPGHPPVARSASGALYVRCHDSSWHTQNTILIYRSRRN